MTLVAVVGGGQLGQMLALAGIPLGLRFRFLDPDRGCPAGRVGELVVGAYDDPEALRALTRGAAVVTFEFENVPAAAAAWLAERQGEGAPPLRPPARSLEVGQDRVVEKSFFRSVGIPTAPFAAVDCADDAVGAVALVGLPAVLKTRRMGYDGKGQRVLMPDGGSPAEQVVSAWRTLGGVPCVLEAFVNFRREVSSIGVRGLDGAVAVYPLVRNVHCGGILRTSRAPADDPDAGQPSLASTMQAGVAAAAHTRRLLEALDHVGTLCIEFFDVGPSAQGGLLANEFAPRVHNSGHWTIEGAATSQFENHLRAILGWPLGDTAVRGQAAMVNLIGDLPPREELLAVPGAALHLYGKDSRPGRKLGHVTVVAASAEELQVRLAVLEALATEPRPRQATT